MSTALYQPPPGDARAAGRRLEFLDGLRGFGALMVFFSHLVAGFFMREQITTEYPALLFLTDGALAVYIFFIVSGFALTESLYGQSGNKGLRPLIVKRYIRLTVPVLAAVLVGYLLLRLDWMGNRQQETSLWIQNFYKHDPSFLRALFDGLLGVILIKSTKYNPVLWSIRPEFFCSVALYVAFVKRDVLLAKAKAWRPAVRRLLLALGLIGTALFVPLAFCFAVGAGLSQLQRQPGLPTWRIRPAWAIALLVLAIAGSTFYRQGYDRGTLPALYATLFFIGIYALPVARQLFASRLGRFLGEISFPLYLIHFPILCSLGPFIYRLAGEDRFTPFGGAVPSTIGTVTIVCLLAAIAFKYIEEGLLRLAYARCAAFT